MLACACVLACNVPVCQCMWLFALLECACVPCVCMSHDWWQGQLELRLGQEGGGGRAVSSLFGQPPNLIFANLEQYLEPQNTCIKRYWNHPGEQKMLFTRDDVGKVR